LDQDDRFNFSGRKRWYVFAGILALFLSAGLCTFLYFTQLPYKMELTFKGPKPLRYHVLYRDLNHDGISEKMHIGKDPTETIYKLIVMKYDETAYDQFNFGEFITARWLIFGDYTGDGFDEIFVFSKTDDSLFLSIVDPLNKRWILKRHFITRAIRYNPAGEWDVKMIGGGLIETQPGKKKELIFYVQTAFAIYPRTVYRFNIEKRKITHAFSTEATFIDIMFTDLNGDGNTEIVLTAGASGNVHFPAKYIDDRNWLFVLDTKLKPIIPPRSFGEYPGMLYPEIIYKNNRQYLFLSNSYGGAKTPYFSFYLLDDQWKIVRRKRFYGRIIRNHIFFNNDFSFFFVLKDTRYNIYNLSSDFEILKKKKFDEIIDLPLFYDIDDDGTKELIILIDRYFNIFDRNFKLLAKSNVEITFLDDLWSVRYNSLTGEKELSVMGLNTIYRFAVVRNPLYGALPWIFLGSWVGFFLLINVGHTLILMLFIFISFFYHSLQRSPRAILILNGEGLIKFVNGKFAPMLQIFQPVKRNQHYREFLKERPQLQQVLEQALNTGKAVTEKISIIDSQGQFEGEMSVTPVFFPLGLFKIFFVEIMDFTETVLSERLQVWSKSVQKMAHDIKTPLSSVVLNLHALQLRLQQGENLKREEILDDIETMRSELEKVHKLTRNFLKFIDLENPHFQFFDLGEIIQRAIQRFRDMKMKKVEFVISVDDDLEYVWGDPEQIELVFHILFENAIDAMQGKGVIRTNVTLAQNLSDFNRRFVEIEVSDTGPGIDEDIRDRIFQPYFSTKADGTGMGLAIAKKIIEDHGGIICIIPGRKLGTVFRISLPIIEERENGSQTVSH